MKLGREFWCLSIGTTGDLEGRPLESTQPKRRTGGGRIGTAIGSESRSIVAHPLIGRVLSIVHFGL